MAARVRKGVRRRMVRRCRRTAMFYSVMWVLG
jgi:hypothetical protein